LTSGEGPGAEVHAASFIRQRRMILDRELRSNQAELSRILVHEVFHFVWVRLSNNARNSWRGVLEKEIEQHARGELGWSSEYRKTALLGESARSFASRRWSEYSCESFCDTAAWIYAAFLAEHEEHTLAARFRKTRRAWFAGLIEAHGGGLWV
jgi:hypothetical protein